MDYSFWVWRSDLCSCFIILACFWVGFLYFIDTQCLVSFYPICSVKNCGKKKVGGLTTIVLGCVELKCSYISREVHARSRRMVSERFMVMT